MYRDVIPKIAMTPAIMNMHGHNHIGKPARVITFSAPRLDHSSSDTPIAVLATACITMSPLVSRSSSPCTHSMCHLRSKLGCLDSNIKEEFNPIPHETHQTEHERH